MFSQFVSFLDSMSYSEIVSYAIGVMGILTSIITYLRSKRIQEPKYKKISSIITEDLFSRESCVHIQNGDDRLKVLTITKVAFWNEGITLKKEEISSKSPFRIELTKEDSQLLEAYVSFSEEENDVLCDISENGRIVNIHFDYLAKNQGFVLKVLHTGLGSSALDVKGSMKNNGMLKKSESLNMRVNAVMLKFIPLRKIDLFFGYFFIFCGLILISKGVFSYGRFIEAHVTPVSYVVLDVILGLFTIIFGYYIQKGKMPDKVSKAFYDEI